MTDAELEKALKFSATRKYAGATERKAFISFCARMRPTLFESKSRREVLLAWCCFDEGWRGGVIGKAL